MAEGAGEAELHAHAAREPLHGLCGVEAVRSREALKPAGVPRAVGAGVDAPHVCDLQVLGERYRVKDDADLLFSCGSRRAGEVFAGTAEYARLAPVDGKEAQERLDGGGFAGAVLADKAHYFALGNGEVDALERESVVVLGEAVRLDEGTRWWFG